MELKRLAKEFWKVSKEAARMNDLDTATKAAESAMMVEDEARKAEAKANAISNLVAEPGKVVFTTAIDPAYYAQTVNVPMHYGNTITLGTPMGQTKEERQRVAKRDLKLFIHFAKMFIEKHPEWKLEPVPEDPFNKVVLIRPDRGLSITSCYPDNQVAIYGGPQEFNKRHNNGVEYLNLPVAKVVTQEFYGWALGEDVPEWI